MAQADGSRGALQAGSAGSLHYVGRHSGGDDGLEVRPTHVREGRRTAATRKIENVCVSQVVFVKRFGLSAAFCSFSGRSNQV